MIFPLSRWLRPSGMPCPLCERENFSDSGSLSIPVRHAGPSEILRGLCETCRVSIPWIRTPLCRTCGRPEACPDCPRRTARQYTFCRSAVRYDERMKSLLALYKYRGSERLEALMAAMLAHSLERVWTELPEPPAGQPVFHLVTSVPLAPERLAERGFNQAERLALRLAGWYGILHLPILYRVRHTEKQSLKNRRSRLADMQGNFAAHETMLTSRMYPGQANENFRIVLIDDVYTTGSTMNECARALKDAVVQAFLLPVERIDIYGILWARS
jgi:competence protein ComFC